MTRSCFPCPGVVGCVSWPVLLAVYCALWGAGPASAQQYAMPALSRLEAMHGQLIPEGAEWNALPPETIAAVAAATLPSPSAKAQPSADRSTTGARGGQPQPTHGDNSIWAVAFTLVGFCLGAAITGYCVQRSRCPGSPPLVGF